MRQYTLKIIAIILNYP